MRSPLSRSEAILLQKRLSAKVISKDLLPVKRIKRVCGIDAAYKDDTAYCCGVIVEKDNPQIVIETVSVSMRNASPYIPGLLMLRESNPILKAMERLPDFDLLLVDGHGQLHPRRCGLACYVGLRIDKPVIGVAKSLLCGSVRSDSRVEYDGKILGYEIKNGKKKIYVSVGHKISLRTAARIVGELILDQRWYPEPLRLADLCSKKLRNTSLAKVTRNYG